MLDTISISISTSISMKWNEMKWMQKYIIICPSYHMVTTWSWVCSSICIIHDVSDLLSLILLSIVNIGICYWVSMCQERFVLSKNFIPSLNSLNHVIELRQFTAVTILYLYSRLSDHFVWYDVHWHTISQCWSVIHCNMHSILHLRMSLWWHSIFSH